MCVDWKKEGVHQGALRRAGAKRETGWQEGPEFHSLVQVFRKSFIQQVSWGRPKCDSFVTSHQNVWYDGVRSWAEIQEDEEHFHEYSNSSPAVSGVVCRAVSMATSVDLYGILMWVKAGRGGRLWCAEQVPQSHLWWEIWYLLGRSPWG